MVATRERGIYKRGDIWWIRYAPAPGQMRYESTGSTDRRDAEALLAKRRTDKFKGNHFPEALDTTVGDLVKAYADFMQDTAEGARIKKVIAHAEAFFGPETPVRMLNHREIKRWERLYGSEMVRGRKKRGQHAIRLGLSRLRAMFNFGVKTAVTTVDPFKGYDMPPAPPPRQRIASDDELGRIRAKADVDMVDVIDLAVETGMRRAEIVGLRWPWISVEERLIRLPAWITKTKKGRSVPLSARALEILSWRHSGKPFEGLTSHAVSQRFGYIVTTLEIEDLHFHDLRRTAGVRMRRAGIDPFTIQRILGHAKIDMTSIVYQAFTDDDLRAAADKLGKKNGSD